MSRSYLFVPADSERKLSRAPGAGADALILDLEDAVAEAARPAARVLAANYLREHAVNEVWVRINPIQSDASAADLAAVMPAAPHGIVLPKPCSPSDVVQLAQQLDRCEAEFGLPQGQTRIMPLCTERPEALFTLHAYVGSTPRLAALSWGAEDLAAALSASATRDAHGEWLPTFALARSLALCAAAAAGVAAIDTVFADYRDMAGLTDYAARARRDGFSGMLAIHPAQVEVINKAFFPVAEELEQARRIVALFAANPGAGTLGLDGRMLDRPHLLHAERLLKMAQELDAGKQ